MMIELNAYHLAALVVLVGGAVSSFWNLWYQRKILNQEDVEKMIKEKAYPLVNGQNTKNDVKHIMRKIDNMLTHQQVMENKMTRMGEKLSKEVNQIKIEVVKLTTIIEEKFKA